MAGGVGVREAGEAKPHCTAAAHLQCLGMHLFVLRRVTEQRCLVGKKRGSRCSPTQGLASLVKMTRR